MIVMQYRFTLPADYDMAIVENRYAAGTSAAGSCYRWILATRRRPGRRITVLATWPVEEGVKYLLFSLSYLITCSRKRARI